MAREDMTRFRELMVSDAGFQEKFRKAAEAYTGEQEDKAVFDGVILPLAEEYGLSATYEEFREYAQTLTRSEGNELSEEELAQIAGGKGGGIGVGECLSIGFGLGAGGASTGDDWGADICVLIGAGIGVFKCIGPGESQHM